MTAIEVWGADAVSRAKIDGSSATVLLICRSCRAPRGIDDVQVVVFGGTADLFCRHCRRCDWRQAAA